MNLNMIPNMKIGDWLFKAKTSILRPSQNLQGLCPAFFMLDDPKNLKKNIQVQEPENHQLSVIEQTFGDEFIEIGDRFSDHML